VKVSENKKFDDWTFNHAVKQAKEDLEKEGEVSPVFIGYNQENGIVIIPALFKDDESKRQHLGIARMQFALHGVVHYLMVSEVWFSLIPEEDRDKGTYTRPSDDPNRKEALLVLSVNSERKRQSVLEINRDSEGKFTSLGEPLTTAIPADVDAGLMGDLLPSVESHVPPELREVFAKKLEDLLGIKQEAFIMAKDETTGEMKSKKATITEIQEMT